MATGNSGFDVRYIARLARLELDENELALYGAQLGNILSYMEKLKELDVAGVEPTMHGHGRVNAFRDDIVLPSADKESILANAPARTGDEFSLPKIVEDA